ncbi:hypothetical protein Anapl_04808 [Anas platyrhynchos]|uniref:Uncharacterized protein n=1 Tax=Anas platyrhynchos TaxID=8839 RepID=R0JQU3_ANAPL|nr:hypothetical protein Anapl_04808 [Anas platyrhynchos]
MGKDDRFAEIIKLHFTAASEHCSNRPQNRELFQAARQAAKTSKISSSKAQVPQRLEVPEQHHCEHLNSRHSYRDQLDWQGCDKGFFWYLVAVLLCVLTWSCWARSNAEPGKFCSTTSQQVDFTSYCLRSFTSINKTCTRWKTLD